ncbi:5-(carboxyamino)imidazole ribonucleotide synthase [Alcaligenes endophyticus]|uniref:N5-carboxyaminoimidazole ribonucleotide synthase n=1 Tax=Alcaligenes endophyticus TaxID=1929088 RepID=A0ABT8EGY6_9BURK|nr:5-(carboxyamino)imidazole ribonucleotide synthase [Alcaligenes endophyticus]MCX5589785.1 5-(carboxyamino)imidazole ribonucleotide synthase [Alcaligenes endophyticus]MDN4120552.1 5-(carboxyamino)imidazole ribonucleotide synthase [Alcaligenes endophyticus]
MNTFISASGPALVAPGSWLGMVGGGQLGRMFCHAAQSLGYKVAVLEPDPLSPAGVVADLHICAPYDDEQALASLSERCAAITTEFENVSAQALTSLAQQRRVTPSGEAVGIVQDRIREKAFIAQAGVPLAPYAVIESLADLEQADEALFPGILKAARFGYDGKGQARVATREQALQAYEQFGGVACVLEALQDLEFEISVVMARALDGQVQAFPCARNEHRDGILAVSTVSESLQGSTWCEQARSNAAAIAEQLGYYGVMCVEFFILRDGRLIANEVAPRPHNSGHYTMDASLTCQFEQQVRVMTGLPLGSPTTLCPAIMLNLLGERWFDEQGQYQEPDWQALLAIPGVCLHLYGKLEPRHGRKMGHVNILGANDEQVHQRAAQAAAVLGMAFHE